MPRGVTCSLKSCAYRGPRGACRRKSITLQLTDDNLNEMLCLGWVTPEMRMFKEVVSGEVDGNELDRRINLTGEE